MTDNKKGIGSIIDDLLGGDTEGENQTGNTRGQKGGMSQASNDDNRGWHGDPQGHSEAARKARTSPSQRSSTGSKGGTSHHQLTQAERSKGGKVSSSKQNMRELGREGGSK